LRKALTTLVGAFRHTQKAALMQLPTIRAAGFTAAVDAFAQDGEQLWFISMLGSQQSVRALWARLVKGETAFLGEGDLGSDASECWLAREAWGTWRFHGARLPASAARPRPRGLRTGGDLTKLSLYCTRDHRNI
jgi:hypothetical protein